MKKVIVVDDQRIVGLVVSTFLNKMDFEVYTFDNAIDALRFYEKNEVDLIITDLNMPHLDGFDFIKKVRDKPSRAVDIIAMSGVCNTSDDVQRASKFGIKDFILKPFDFDVFSKKISYLSNTKEIWNEWKIDSKKGLKNGRIENNIELISISEVSLTIRTVFPLQPFHAFRMNFDALKEYELEQLVGSVVECRNEGAVYICKIKIIGLKEVEAKKIRQFCRSIDHIQLRVKKDEFDSTG